MLNMQVPQSPSRGDFRLNAMAWLPLVLMVIAETNTGEIHVPASRDFYSSWHLTEEFIKHFCKKRATPSQVASWYLAQVDASVTRSIPITLT
jgi:hypothetical protein